MSDSLFKPEFLTFSNRVKELRFDDGKLTWLVRQENKSYFYNPDKWKNGREWAIRSRIACGGGDYAWHNGILYFADEQSGKIKQVNCADGFERDLTPGGLLAAAPCLSTLGDFACIVAEEATGAEMLLAYSMAEGKRRSIAPLPIEAGCDFFMQPRFSPRGDRFAFVTWSKQEMPWTSCRLYIANRRSDSAGALYSRPCSIAGGNGVAVLQPEFAPDGRALFYVSDESGWNRIYRYDLISKQKSLITELDADYGGPAWEKNQRFFVIDPTGRILTAVENRGGRHRIVRLNLTTRHRTVVGELAAFSSVHLLHGSAKADRIAFVGGNSGKPATVVEYDFAERRLRSLWHSARPCGRAASCRQVSWGRSGARVHGLLYKPLANGNVLGLCAVVCGGPTSQVEAEWHPTAQFLCEGGFAVLFVNYRGSTGFGREYADLLKGNWGVSDVEDVISGIEHVHSVLPELRERKSVVIGFSAGGLTAFRSALAYPDRIAAVVSWYGIVCPHRFHMSTHAFEKFYTDWLIAASAAELLERSPLQIASAITQPVAFFHGELDHVVPISQAREMAERLINSSMVLFRSYPEEGHGFNCAETVKDAYLELGKFLTAVVSDER